jgi:hypothetical protein
VGDQAGKPGPPIGGAPSAPCRGKQDAAGVIFIPQPRLTTEAGFFSHLQIFLVVIKMALRFATWRNLMDATQSHLDQILDEITSLSLDEQKMLLDILKKRHIEQDRLRIVREVREARREHKKGLTKRGTVEDLMKDLESD